MSEIKIEISDELKSRMVEFPTIDWSAVVGEVLKDELYRLARLKSIVAKSKLTEKDAIELGKKVNVGLARRYRK